MSQSNLILNKLVATIVKQDGSTLHLEVGSKPTARISTKLVRIEDSPVITDDILHDIVKSIFDSNQQKILAHNRSIVAVHTFEGNIRFKIHFFYQKNSLAASFEYLPEVVSSPAEMGLSSQFIGLLRQKKGLIIISGAHNSGKAPTVASLIDYLNNNESKYILTLEDPIQYIFNSQKSIIEQRSIGTDAKDFAGAVKFAQTGDVDIVFISKLNSYDILASVIDLVDSGRLVIAVVEAGSAAEVLEKIIELSPESENKKIRNILSDIFLGLAVQKIVPRRGGGTIIANEILIANPATVGLIKEGNYKRAVTIMQTSGDEGMKTMDQSLVELVRTNEVSYDDALPSVADKSDFTEQTQI